MNDTHLTPAPPRPQAPPARTAPSDSWRSRHSTRAALLWTTGTACTALDESTKR